MLVVKATQLVKAVIAKWNDAIPELSLASLVGGRSGLLRFLVLLLWSLLTHITSTYMSGFSGGRTS